MTGRMADVRWDHFSAIGLVLDRSLVGQEGVCSTIDAIVALCESEQVRHVCSVELHVVNGKGRTVVYESDRYGLTPGVAARQARNRESLCHKTHGLYFLQDADVPGRCHLPPGLSGLRRAGEIARNAEGALGLDVEVVRRSADGRAWIQWVGLTVIDPAGKED